MVDETDDWATAQYEASGAVRRHGGLLIPEATWVKLAEHDRRVPAPSRLPATTVRDLERAWISPVRSNGADDLSVVVERALGKIVAVSEGDEESARRHVRSLARWFESMHDSPAEGELVRAGQDVWPVVLYLDSGREPDEWGVGSWPAFGLREDKALPVFSDWILVPPSEG